MTDGGTPRTYLRAGVAMLAVAVARGAAAPLSEALRPDLWLRDARLGWLTSVFTLAALTTAALLDRRAADRGRDLAPGAALVLLAVATAATGAARGFWTLLALRLAGGVAAGAVLAHLAGLLGAAREARRGALAAVGAAVPAGVALAELAAGLTARLGWRAGFAAAGALVLALAAIAPRPTPGAARGAGLLAPLRAAGLRAATGRLRADLPLALAAGAAAAIALAAGALGAWLPALMERIRGLPRRTATSTLALLVVLIGFVGLAAGVRLARTLAARGRGSPLWTAAGTAGAAGVLALAMVAAWRPTLHVAGLLLGLLLLFAAAATTILALRDRLRTHAADAPALPGAILLWALAGDLVGPPLAGWISDRSSLWRGLLVVPLALLVAGGLLARAARRADRERQAALPARQRERASS